MNNIFSWKKRGKSHRGMTLIEVLVAIFLISVGLVGIMSFYSMNVKGQFEAREELVATNLAQECIEIVKNIRDYNHLAGLSWKTGINTSVNCPFVDFFSISSHACNNSATEDICEYANTRRYYQCPLTSGALNKTVFKRRIISIADVPATSSEGAHLDVTCEVWWGYKNIQAKEKIYEPNWQ